MSWSNQDFASVQMVYKKLGKTDINVSKISLGGSAFGNVFGFCSEEEVRKIISTAFHFGVNLIDTSPFYGLGKLETIIGKVIPLLNIPRESFYISSKVGRYEQNVFDFSSQRVVKSIEESLKRLQLDCIDIVFAHDIEFAPSIDIVIKETLPTLDQLKEEGKLNYIGISGYPLNILKKTLYQGKKGSLFDFDSYIIRKVVERSKTKIDVVLTYCHYSLNDTSLLDYISFFKSKGIGILNAAPLSMGLLTPDGPMPWHPATDEIKDAAKKAISICQAEKVSIAKLAVNFSCSNEMIDSTICSCVKEKYLVENIHAAFSQLTCQEKDVMLRVKKECFDPIKHKVWGD